MKGLKFQILNEQPLCYENKTKHGSKNITYKIFYSWFIRILFKKLVLKKLKMCWHFAKQRVVTNLQGKGAVPSRWFLWLSWKRVVSEYLSLYTLFRTKKIHFSNVSSILIHIWLFQIFLSCQCINWQSAWKRISII